MAAGALGALGALVKPTVLTVNLACAVALSLDAMRCPTARRAALTVLGAGALTTMLVLGGLNTLLRQSDAGQTIHSEPFPLEYYLLTGLDERPGDLGNFYGAFSPAAVHLMVSTPSVEVRKTLARDAIRAQLRERGVIGTFRFLVAKAVWVYSDGTFFAFGEAMSRGRAPYRHEKPGFALVQRIANPAAEFGVAWATALQIVWLAMLIAALFASILDARNGGTAGPSLLTSSLAAVTAYQLLLEARPRYLFIFVPLLVATAFTASRKPRADGQ
jgi:hypothetical protein